MQGRWGIYYLDHWERDEIGGGGLTIDLKGHHICQGVSDFVRRWGRDVIGQQIEVFIAFQGSTQSHLHVNDWTV